MTRDKWLLTGAWAVMAAFGALTYYKVSHSPKIDPTIEKLCKELEKPTLQDRPERPATFKPPFRPTDAGLAYIDPEASRFRPKFKKVEIDHKVYEIHVLPQPVMGWT